jgi:hypothetical protein
VRKVYALLRARRQEAVASGPLAAGAGDPEDAQTPEGAAVAGRLPVSWLPETRRSVASASATATEEAGGISSAGSASPDATSASPDAELSDPAATTGTADDGRLSAAARANVQTLVRACWPGTLSPGLSSTRLRFAFVAARHTGVGLVSDSDEAARDVLARLRLWGFPAARLTLEDGGWQPPQAGPLLCYRPGFRTAALALAGDLGLPARSVARTGDSPGKLVLVLAE